MLDRRKPSSEQPARWSGRERLGDAARALDVHSGRVLEAVRRVPRERFVPEPGRPWLDVPGDHCTVITPLNIMSIWQP